MAAYLPSEIARLVYGYLEEEGCSSAAQAFLQTSIHLQECYGAVKKGRKFHTKIMGRTLVGIFELLCEVSLALLEVAECLSWSSPGYEKIKELLKLLQLDDSSRKRNVILASSGNITSTVEESPGEEVEKPKENFQIAGSNTPERVSLLQVRLPEDINEGIESIHHWRKGTKGRISPRDPLKQEPSENEEQAGTTSSATNERDSTEVLLKRIKVEKEDDISLSVCSQAENSSIVQQAESSGSLQPVESSSSSQQMESGGGLQQRLHQKQQQLVVTHHQTPAASEVTLQQSPGVGQVVMAPSILCQTNPWSNMLQMYQPTTLRQQVFMQAPGPSTQQNVILRHENLPAIVTPSVSVSQAPTAWPTVTSVSQVSTAWSKATAVSQESTMRTKSQSTSVTLAPGKSSKKASETAKHGPKKQKDSSVTLTSPSSKHTKGNQSRPTPKLRAIAPKMVKYD